MLLPLPSCQFGPSDGGHVSADALAIPRVDQGIIASIGHGLTLFITNAAACTDQLGDAVISIRRIELAGIAACTWPSFFGNRPKMIHMGMFS